MDEPDPTLGRVVEQLRVLGRRIQVEPLDRGVGHRRVAAQRRPGQLERARDLTRLLPVGVEQVVFALDPEERRQLLTDAQQILSDDGPVIVSYFRSFITAHSNRLQGFRAHPLRYLDLRRAWLEG